MVGGRGLRSDVCSNEKAEPHNVVTSALHPRRHAVECSQVSGKAPPTIPRGAPRQEVPMNIGEGLIWRPR